ncbi:MAG: diversity-generating retroelement protein Avd [Anaerolineales bacterium]
MDESPVYTSTYDLLLWLLPLTQTFPRAWRFSLTERIQRVALDFQDQLVAAGKHKGAQRQNHLRYADVRLEQLRHWMRYARDMKIISLPQYEHFARMVTQTGNFLGAWIKDEMG